MIPTELYRPSASCLRRWYAARANTAAGVTQGHVVVVGDSIAFGAAASGASLPKHENCWPGLLRASLDARFGPAGTGIVLAQKNVRANPTWDPRWGFAGSVSDQAFGLHKEACFRPAAGSGEIEFTADCDEFIVANHNTAGGQNTAYVDNVNLGTFRNNYVGGGTPTFAPEAGNHQRLMVTHIPAGTEGEHTLKVTPPAATYDLFLSWVEARINTLGTFRISNPSINGRSLYTLGADGTINNDETTATYGLPLLDAMQADLMIVALGINDWQNSRSVANFKAYVTTLVERQRSAGANAGGGNHADGDVLLLWNPQPDVDTLVPGADPTWQQYRDALYEVADTEDCALLDLGMRWGGFATGDAAGYFSDPIHPTDLGAADIASVVESALFEGGAVLQSGPVDSFVVSGVPGQVPAFGNLTVRDTSSEDRHFGEIGVQDEFDPDNPEPILLEGVTDLSGLSGSSNTRSGSVSTNVVRASLTTTEVAVCSTGAQPHKGRWRVRCRVWPSAPDVRVRLAWRTGDGAWDRSARWRQVPNEDGWYDLDLGFVNITELQGDHSWEARIEARCDGGAPTIDIDTLTLIPADSYLKVQGSSAIDLASSPIVASDDFSAQTSGALNGKAPLIVPASTWTRSGDSTDFQVDTVNEWIYRDAVSDADINTGCYQRCGSGTLTHTGVSVDVYLTFFPGSTIRCGAFLRYTDTNNWLAAVYTNATTLSLIKRVSGTVTVLATAPIFGTFGQWKRISAAVGTTGTVLVYEGIPDSPDFVARILVSNDSDLATGGALASGGYGILDTETSGSSGTRMYDNFVVTSPSTAATLVNPAINADRELNVLHNNVLTASADGSVFGVTPGRTGNYLTLPPATRAGRKSRIVTRFRRQDIDAGFADSGLSDATTAELSVTPRVHLTGRNQT